MQVHVFADNGDFYLAVRFRDSLDDSLPFAEFRMAALDVHLAQQESIQFLVVKGEGNLVDGGRIVGADDSFLFNVGEERDFAPQIIAQRFCRAKNEGIGLDSDFLQFLDRVLRGFCLYFAAGNGGYERYMNGDGVLFAELVDELAACLQKGN